MVEYGVVFHFGERLFHCMVAIVLGGLLLGGVTIGGILSLIYF